MGFIFFFHEKSEGAESNIPDMGEVEIVRVGTEGRKGQPLGTHKLWGRIETVTGRKEWDRPGHVYSDLQAAGGASADM